MNCDKAQENMYEYLDGSLSPSDRTALRAHLENCVTCREIFEREMNLARSVSSRLQDAVRDARLEPNAQRRIAAIAAKQLPRTPRNPAVSFRWRLALNFATAAAILGMIVIAYRQSDTHHTSKPQAERAAAASAVPEISVNLSYGEPAYVFHWEGDTVVDALIYEPRVTETLFAVKN